VALAAAAAVVVIVSLPRTAPAAGPAAAAVPSCSLNTGETVMLHASDFDPDVLVWDSKSRAIAYASGGMKDADDVLNHTLLAPPGTRAIVIGCAPDSAHTRYSDVVQDTVGVKIISGTHRGRYGWVTSDDIRSTHTADARP
jgi:hypothetical protein